jgi:hypothetical protein
MGLFLYSIKSIVRYVNYRGNGTDVGHVEMKISQVTKVPIWRVVVTYGGDDELDTLGMKMDERRGTGG